MTKSLSANLGEMKVTVPKTPNSIRTVVTPRETVDLLIEEHEENPDSPYLFMSPTTWNMFHPDAIGRAHKKLLDQAGIDQAVRFHDLRHTAAAQAERPKITNFKPYMGTKRKPGTGCVSEINDHLFEGRYSPMWPNGKKHARNVYAKTWEECEEKLKVLIVQMKMEIAEAKKKAVEGK